LDFGDTDDGELNVFRRQERSPPTSISENSTQHDSGGMSTPEGFLFYTFLLWWSRPSWLGAHCARTAMANMFQKKDLLNVVQKVRGC
jgi:hypothetical protein